MTDLTSQWKKGELPSDEYWCLSICGDVDKLYFYQNSFWKYKTEDDYYGVPVEIKQVLAPVPSYEQWQAKLEENKRLKHDIGNLVYKIKNQRKEIERQIAQNTKLKELLDDCRIELYYWNDKDCELIVRINQVLADNKIQANTVACNKIQENK